jgi:hypothetical protein
LRRRFDGWSYVLVAVSMLRARVVDCGCIYQSILVISMRRLHSWGFRLTITIDRTVGAWLLAVAFDLLSPAFVACACYATPLLEWLWLRYLVVAEIIGRRSVVVVFRALLVL